MWLHGTGACGQIERSLPAAWTQPHACQSAGNACGAALACAPLPLHVNGGAAGTGSNVSSPLWQCARYITNPLLIDGRKFGLRLWALVPGASPLRAYLHRNGLALFSSAPYHPEGEKARL